ncbi:MAG: S9 family peptidase [Proteobacteria bacterium]|nr:S9 family peptidase [Pseudomonadota bacterium]
MSSASSPPPRPRQPLAPRRPHTVPSPHGGREDPYYWLRDDARKDREVLAYLRAHNRYTAQWFKDHGNRERRLYREIVARMQQDDSTVPYFKRGHWYYARFSTGQEYPVLARRPGTLEAPEQILLDVNALAAGHAFFDLGTFEVSPDGRFLAWCEDRVGRREYSLWVKNLASGEVSELGIGNIEADLVWLNDSISLLYVAKDPQTLLGRYVRQHRVGTDPAHDGLVFEQDDPSFYTTIARTKSDRFVLLGMESTLSSEWRYAEADDPEPRFRTVLPREREHEYQVEHWGEEFILRSNRQAPNFRLVRVPIGAAGDASQWRDLQAHHPQVFIHDFEVMKSFIAVSERSGGLKRLRIRPLRESAGREDFLVDAGEPAYTMSLGVNVDLDSDTLRYTFTSLKTPPSVLDCDLHTRTRTLKKQERVLGDFDPDRYATQFIRAPGRDGAQIPVSLVYRKDTPLDGTAPLLQYGYGAYGHSLDPGFSSARLSLLDRGLVFALAHVRGGQDLGRAWYDEGRLLHKKNSFHDFIDVTKHLVELKVAAPDRVFAMGGSAGGLLMGAVANLAPQAYRGIIAQVPFVDMVTTMLDSSLPLTTNEFDEWGNPTERRYYDYMLSYSPYDNVGAQHYPAMYVTTGLWDSQVQYFEPAKWVARLLERRLGEEPLLLHTDLRAGHGGKSGRFERLREVAREYAFILNVAGVHGARRRARIKER